MSVPTYITPTPVPEAQPVAAVVVLPPSPMDQAKGFLAWLIKALGTAAVVLGGVVATLEQYFPGGVVRTTPAPRTIPAPAPAPADNDTPAAVHIPPSLRATHAEDAALTQAPGVIAIKLGIDGRWKYDASEAVVDEHLAKVEALVRAQEGPK